MSEFDRLWECAANLHKALNKSGHLTLVGRQPSFSILVEYEPSSLDHKSMKVASGEFAVDAVCYLIASYIKQANEQIKEIQRNSQTHIDHLQAALAEAKRNGC